MRHCLYVLMTLLCMAGAGRALAQTDAEQVMAIGRNVLSMDDYMLAIQYFNQAIKAKPYLAEPYYLRALAKLSLEDYEGADTDCTLAIERNKFLPESYRLRGFARQSMGLDSLAVNDYDTGLEYNPQDRYFLFYKGVALTELGKYAAADSTLATLLRLYPRMDDAYTARGRLRTLSGDTVGALADIDKAISLSGSTTVQPFLLRADIEVKRRDWTAATSDMDQAIRLRPDAADYYLNRAFIRYNAEDWFGAMADYNYTLELDPANTAARFNRALLRYEVSDLDRAAEDLNAVLGSDPNNFHARYNLGLVNLERGRWREALSDFDAIARRYPRFHPVYYARAEALRGLGDLRRSMQSVHKGDDLVRAFARDPEKNPLERPAIQAGEANDGSERDGEQVMHRFNQLVTAGGASETELAYNDRIKGRVQDRNLNIAPEPPYMISFAAPEATLQSTSNYFRELDDLNASGYMSRKAYLLPASAIAHDEFEYWFAEAESLEHQASGSTRAADWMALGVARAMLRDYEAARRALDRAIELYPGFAAAYMERAYCAQADPDPRMQALAAADYDAALALNPNLAFAWHNKGNIHSFAGDWTSAIDAYSKALAIMPTLGASYYNRALAYLHLGNRTQAFADLRAAGEQGLAAAYNLLKRMK